MITPELRALRTHALGCTSNAPPAIIADAATGSASKMARDAAPIGLGLSAASPFRLRRDGDRPLCLDGWVVFRTSGLWADGQTTFDHAFALYRDLSGTLVVTLVLAPKDNLALRPIHWAQSISDANALWVLLRAWCRDVLAPALNLGAGTPSKAAAPALHMLTSHALAFGQPDTERNDVCPQ